MGRADVVVWRLRAADLDRIAGRTVSHGELQRISRSIEHSCIPEAVEVIVEAVTGRPAP